MSDNYIHLRISDGAGNETVLRVSTTDPFHGVVQRYADETGQAHEDFSFSYEGTRLMSTSTPHELKMDDNDIVLAEGTRV
ncbi:sumo domain-containing protein [Streptomyces sp. NPDC051561]|uniref:sumo domain-containing protein n=1 Tax=Streptomyces sp. NPDC051561 TaxID=3365658 RepID=UPI003789353F